MFDSQRLHGLQPTRLLCPWDFPGKSTGVGAMPSPYEETDTSNRREWRPQAERSRETEKREVLTFELPGVACPKPIHSQSFSFYELLSCPNSPFFFLNWLEVDKNSTFLSLAIECSLLPLHAPSISVSPHPPGRVCLKPRSFLF